jgi:hypothetical protein
MPGEAGTTREAESVKAKLMKAKLDPAPKKVSPRQRASSFSGVSTSLSHASHAVARRPSTYLKKLKGRILSEKNGLPKETGDDGARKMDDTEKDIEVFRSSVMFLDPNPRRVRRLAMVYQVKISYDYSTKLR